MSITPSSSTPRTGGLGRFGFQAGLAGAVAVPVAVAGLWMATSSGGEVAVRSADAPASLAMDDSTETVRHVVDLGALGTVEVMESNGVLVLGEVQVADGWDVTELAIDEDGAITLTLADDEQQVVAHIAAGEADDELDIEIGEPEPVAPKPAVEPVKVDDADEADKLEADDEATEKDTDEKDTEDADEKDGDHLDKDEPTEVQTRADIDAEVGDVVIERDGDVLTYTLTRLDAGFTHHTWANQADYVKGYLTNETGTYWFKAWIEGSEIKTRTWFEKAEAEHDKGDDKDHDKEEPADSDEPAEVQTRAEIDAEVGQIVVERDEWTLTYAVASVMAGYDEVVLSASGDHIKGYFTDGEHQYWFKAWIDGAEIKTRAWHEQVEQVEVQTSAQIDAEVGQIAIERDGDQLVYGVIAQMEGFDRVMISEGGSQVKGYFTNGEHEYWFKAWIDGAEIKTNAWFEQVEAPAEEA